MKSIWPVDELTNYLPHRVPMVWVDRIVEVGKDYKGLVGTCIVKLDKSALYVSDEKCIRASAAIEFTAQGFGYLKAAYQEIHNINNPPEETYLTGVRSCEADFSSLELEDGLELEVRLSVLREILPLTYVKGEISVVGSKNILATTEIQVYFA